VSVINKMLRDLDSRRATGTTGTQSGESRTGVTRNTASVKGARRATQEPSSGRWGRSFLMLGLVLGLGAAVWWLLVDRGIVNLMPERRAVTAPVTVVVPKPVPVPAPVPASSLATVASVVAATPTLKIEPVVVAALSSQASVPPALAASSPVAKPPVNNDNAVKVAARDPKPVATPPPQPPSEHAPVSRAAVPVAKSSLPVLAPSPTAQRQAAVRETLAQAQNLWNSGAHEAALELMRDAVAVAERSSTSGEAADGAALLAPLVQELARMELAEGRVSQVLDMLTRLEPVLSGQADLWAVRGNAAQRLGRHQDSVNAYLKALKLRPNEPRWMLGAAVSLAAQGQTAAAAEWAEKARAGGVVSPEVSAYLRQLGVSLRER